MFTVGMVLKDFLDNGDEAKKVVQNQLQLPHTASGESKNSNNSQASSSGAIPMAMNTGTPVLYPEQRRGGRGRSSSVTTPSTTSNAASSYTYPKRDHRVVRHYLGSAAYPQRVIDDLMTEAEAREHCLGIESSSMTCTSKAGKRRTRRLGHWFDTFEKYR